jgi:phage baseplate assembly protein V
VVWLRQSGIEITHASRVTITAPLVQINGNVQVSGTVVAQGNVTGQGTSLRTHTHGGVQPGGSNTGAPV